MQNDKNWMNFVEMNKIPGSKFLFHCDTDKCVVHCVFVLTKYVYSVQRGTSAKNCFSALFILLRLIFWLSL